MPNMSLNTNTRTFIIEKKKLPLTPLEWGKLEKIVENAEFEAPKHGDTYEALSLKVMRAKKPSDPTFYNKPLLDLLNKAEMKEFLQKVLEMKEYYIDRVQIHHYQKGDFIAMHCDNDSCPDYKYACILHMTEGYEGGDFRVKEENQNIINFKVPKYTLLITSCALPHEVTKVISGERKVIIWFVSEKDLTQKIPLKLRKAS